MLFLVDLILLAFVCACCACDLRTRRIPNALSGVGALLGVALNAAHGGLPAAVSSVAGMALMTAVLLAPFAVGGVGGGDVKMMAAVGAFLGPRLAMFGLTAGLILGGIVMALHLIRVGRLLEKLRSLGSMIGSVVTTQTLAGLHVSARDPGAISLPYSIPLGLGTLATLVVARALGSPTSF